MLNVNTNRNISSFRLFESQQSDTPYVMQGNAEKKELDVYHLILAPTYACNLRCKHCYLPNHGNDLLPRSVVLRLIDEWSEIVIEERGQCSGIFHVKGGEPFIIPYLWDIAARLAELKSLRLMLTTNGTFASEDIFRRLRDCRDKLDGHFTVVVSLDGATEESNTKLRGKGQFIKTMKFLKRLQKYDVNFYLNCVLHNGNLNELSKYIDLARKYEATQVNFLSLIPRGNGLTFRDQQIPHFEIYFQLKDLYRNGDSKTKNMLAGSLSDIKYKEKSRGCPTSDECVAAYRGLLYITPDGSAFTCPNLVFADNCLGNVFDHSLKKIIDNISGLHNYLKVHTGAYLCTGEKMLYEMEEDISCLKSLHNLQNILDPAYSTYEKSQHSVSYCFNRNW